MRIVLGLFYMLFGLLILVISIYSAYISWEGLYQQNLAVGLPAYLSSKLVLVVVIIGGVALSAVFMSLMGIRLVRFYSRPQSIGHVMMPKRNLRVVLAASYSLIVVLLVFRLMETRPDTNDVFPLLFLISAIAFLSYILFSAKSEKSARAIDTLDDDMFD